MDFGRGLTAIGTPLRRDVVSLANHVSWLDILGSRGADGTAFVAKAELAKCAGDRLARRAEPHFYVQREARMNVAAQINALREALADNWSIAIFPEGTTTDGLSLLPFKSSMLKLLEPPPARVLVQPVLLDYGALSETVGWVGDESGIANAVRLLARAGQIPVRLHFLEPFAPGEHPGRKAVAARARAEIETALMAALGKPLRPFAHAVAPVRYRGLKGEPGDPPT